MVLAPFSVDTSDLMVISCGSYSKGLPSVAPIYWNSQNEFSNETLLQEPWLQISISYPQVLTLCFQGALFVSKHVVLAFSQSLKCAIF